MAARRKKASPRQAGSKNAVPGTWRPLPPRQQAQFYEQLGRMLKSGLPPSVAVASLQRTPWPPPLKALADAMAQHLQHGEALSAVFKRFEPVVTTFDCAYIEAAEAAGTLSDGFDVLAKRQWARHEQLVQTAGRLIYPLCVLAVAAILGPLHLAFEGHLGQYFSTAARPLVALVAGIAGVAWLVLTPALGPWRSRLYRAGTRLPVLAPLLRRLAIARLGLLLASCFRAGLPAATVFSLAGAAMADPEVAAGCLAVERDIQAGSTLTEAVARHPRVFPHELVSVIETGEQAGRLDESLAAASAIWREDADRSLDTLLRIAVGLVVALALGAVALIILQIGLGIIGRVNEVILQ